MQSVLVVFLPLLFCANLLVFMLTLFHLCSRIQIIPYFKHNWTITGQVFIKFKCVKETKNIVLNVKHLRLDKNSLKVSSEANGEGLAINHTEHDEKSEVFIIQLKEKLTEGADYTVFIKYVGNIKNSPSGLYRTVFYLVDGNRR